VVKDGQLGESVLGEELDIGKLLALHIAPDTGPAQETFCAADEVARSR
jgi:hypothetical protein